MKEQALWRNIGLESEPSSSSSLNKPSCHPHLRKAYDLEFEDLGSESDHYSGQLIKVRRVSSPFQNEDTNKSQQNRSPMIMTMDDPGQEVQEVIEAISFESYHRDNQNSIHQILQHMQEESFEGSEGDRRQPLRNKHKNQQHGKKAKMLHRLSQVLSEIGELKQELMHYKMYLLNMLSTWQVKAIKDCQKMRESIDYRVHELVDSRDKTKARGIRETRELKLHNNDLQLELHNLRQQLENERHRNKLTEQQAKEAHAALHKTIAEAELKKFKALDARRQDEQAIQQQLIRTEKQLTEARLQTEDVTHQMTKLKDTIKDKEHRIALQNEQNDHLLKQISGLKRQLEDAQTRERRTEMKVQLQTQQRQQQYALLQQQNSKAKSQMNKLRQLLKNSEQQLKSCEGFLANLSHKLKDKEQDAQVLKGKMNEEKMLYYKKLQNFDRVLQEIEQSVQEITSQHLLKAQEINDKEAQLQKLAELLQIREIDLNQKEYQVEEIQDDLKREITLLEKKEEGMRAEYKMAVNAQNITKDKWYQRYYQLCSDRDDRSKYSSSPSLKLQAALNAHSVKPSFKKLTKLERPVRDKDNAVCNILTKAKSQYNLGARSRPRADLSRKKSQVAIPESYRDTTITSRINKLRTELSRQLTNIDSR